MGENEIKVGDKVKVVHSPYSSVKVGTITYVDEIRFADRHPNWRIFILRSLRNQAFRLREITKVADEY